MRLAVFRLGHAAALIACLFAAGIAAAQPVRAADPVKQIAIYVEPFYRASEKDGEAPAVGVGAPYQELLASTKLDDIKKARDMIEAHSGLVTPMTMMVLAIRFYDLGARDDAVFWFYAARDRMITAIDVAQPGATMLVQAVQAMQAFNALAGPVINGYAFCDIKKQRDLRTKALTWVEAHPYEAVFLDKIPARSEDRKALLAKSIAMLKTEVEKETAYLADKANVEQLKSERTKSEADTRFCWR